MNKKIIGLLVISVMAFSLLPIAAAEVVEDFQLMKGKPGGGGGGTTTQFIDWGYLRIGAADARAATSGVVQVAVLDSGIDATHPDLAGLVTWAFSGIKRADYPVTDRNVKDDDGHGTHVAGTIAALDNDEGIVGAAADHVELYSGKVLGRRGGDWYDLAWSIMHATDGPDGVPGTADDPEVITMSLGGDISSSQTLIDTIQDAVDYARSYGVAVLASAGNEGTCEDGDVQLSWPAMANGVITVGATGIYDGTNFVNDLSQSIGDVMPCFSNEMPAGVVDVSAPGVYITSLAPGGGTAEMSGTSMATPYTAAIVALLMANGLSANQALARLTSTAIDLGYPSTLQGAGLIDAAAAV